MVTSWSWLAGLCFLLQVPPPAEGTEPAQKLEAARRSIVAREAAELNELAALLVRQEKTDAATLVRARASPSGDARRPDAVHASAGSLRAA